VCSACRIAWPPTDIRPWFCPCFPARRLIWSWPMRRPISSKAGATRALQPQIKSSEISTQRSAGCGPATLWPPSMCWASASGGMSLFWRSCCLVLPRAWFLLCRCEQDAPRRVLTLPQPASRRSRLSSYVLSTADLLIPAEDPAESGDALRGADPACQRLCFVGCAGADHGFI